MLLLLACHPCPCPPAPWLGSLLVLKCTTPPHPPLALPSAWNALQAPRISLPEGEGAGAFIPQLQTAVGQEPLLEFVSALAFLVCPLLGKVDPQCPGKSLPSQTRGAGSPNPVFLRILKHNQVHETKPEVAWGQQSEHEERETLAGAKPPRSSATPLTADDSPTPLTCHQKAM